jgi:hypothetical protein
MIEINKERLSKAVEKARKVRNFVHMIQFRLYEVTTPELRAYQVAFEVRDGKKFANCNCKAGKRNQPCYHMAAAVALHLAVAQMRAEAEKPQAAAQQVESNLLTFKPREILIKRDCNHATCKTSRCEREQRIGGIAV